jgi:hypothetical protein
MFRKIFFYTVILSLLMTGCTSLTASRAIDSDQAQVGLLMASTVTLASTLTTTPLPPATATPLPPLPTPTLTPTQPVLAQAQPPAAVAVVPASGIYGPDVFPAGINPLTGMPVSNGDNLSVPPVLISITNWPVTARPQAGLSFSDWVFEIFIGEGSSRFLALFYGDFPKKVFSPLSASTDPQVLVDDSTIGPIRSGRLPYESLRKLSNGSLVMASADAQVAASLNGFTNVFGSDGGDINSAMIKATQLEAVARANKLRLPSNSLNGLLFDPKPPAGGKDGQSAWLAYNLFDQVFWRYNSASGKYNRFQDNADAKTFIEATDRLNGIPLGMSNVVYLFAQHVVYNPTVIDINLLYITRMPALIFRDGKMYEAYWTTRSGDYERRTGLMRPIRFMDAQGNPFPLKPGQTWVQIVPQFTPYYETVDSENYLDLANKKQPGSGHWAIRFFVPQ